MLRDTKSALIANGKSHTGFRSVPKLATLSDLEQPNGRHYALFHTKRQLSEPNNKLRKKHNLLVRGNSDNVKHAAAVGLSATLQMHAFGT